MIELKIKNGVLTDYFLPIPGMDAPRDMTDLFDAAFKNIDDPVSVTIPEGVTSIGDRAFKDCSNLVSVTIPEGVTSIGREAFSGCVNLTHITIPASVVSIGTGAFGNCQALTAIRVVPENKIYRSEKNCILSKRKLILGCKTSEIPAGVTSIGSYAFFHCESLAHITIPAGVTGIGESTFSHCRSLTDITVPDGAASIGRNAFRNCRSLKSITIPASVTGIGYYAFEKCNGLTAVHITDMAAWCGISFKEDFTNPLYFAEHLYLNGTEVTDLVIPTGITGIGAYAFIGCSGLKHITIPDGVTKIDHHAFSRCSGLISVTIPDSVTRIHLNAFSDCKRLKYITIPDNEIQIDPSAFKGCSLKRVSIPAEALELTGSAELWSAADIPAEAFIRILKKRPPVIMRQPEGSDIKSIIERRILEDTSLAAVRYHQEQECTDEYYAAHQKDEGAVMDRLSDALGLDAHGTRRLIAGNKCYTATLQEDLSFVLTDETGKTVGGIPDNTPEGKAADAAFAALREDIKTAAEFLRDGLFSDFLSGYARSAADWQTNRMNRFLLKPLVRRIVWSQNGNTFTVHGDGRTYEVSGAAYILTEQPVTVAHPMEMGPALTKRWQDYFAANGLKQPFEQVREPVIDESYVKPDRYEGCFVPQSSLIHKIQHGIKVVGAFRIDMKNCQADVKWGLADNGTDFEYDIENFRYQTYSRQVNHIVSILDRETVAGRIQKDDVTVQQCLDSFTLPQILNFIDLAARSNAKNVSALLLEYKKTRFGETDVPDKFRLDL